jgi:hypothetical protein
MQDTIRIGAAALGGYVLGRTKKAKTAITLALWLSGKGRPSDMARTQAVKALQSDKGQELLAQLRGPVMSAGRQAALSVFEAQAGRVSDSLSRRTELLSAPAGSKSKSTSKRGRKSSGGDGDELSERRRRPAGRKADRDRRPPRSRDAEGPEDEYEDDDDLRDEYDDEPEQDDEGYEDYEDDEDAEEDEEDDEDAEEDDEGADDDEYADEYEDDEEDYEDDEDEDEDDEDERAPSRRRAS